VDGYKPIYVNETTFLSAIKTTPSKAIGNASKILSNQSRMFGLEKDKGVQVWDNSDTTKAPVPLFYIEATYTQSIGLTGTFLILQNNLGLVYLETSALPNIAIHHFLERGNVQKPPPFKDINGNLIKGKVYFECPTENTDQVILQWESKNLTKPKCFIRTR
jgi:hypothetical protein